MESTLSGQDAMSALGKGGLVSTVVGGLATALGVALAQGDYEKAEKLRQQAYAELAKLNPDELAKVKAEIGDSAFSSITEAPEGRQAQKMALERLQAISNEDDPQSAAEYAKAQQEAAANERGVRMAALQRLAQRGAGATSGLALAAQQDAAQASTQTANQRSLQVAADARRRALEALSMQGQMGTQLRSSDYQLQRDRAQAQDSINRFNADARWRQAQTVYDARAQQGDRMAKSYEQQAKEREAAAGRTAATTQAVGGTVGKLGDTALMALTGGLI
jgi:hypothetical protein